MSNEIYHHGIKGMKWGIRRYQNSDGTLTSEGKKRYGKNKYPESEDHKQVRELRKKPARAMSNKELQTAINRMNLEKQYRNLSKEERKAGKNYVRKVLSAGKTMNDIYSTFNSPFYKKLRKALG